MMFYLNVAYFLISIDPSLISPYTRFDGIRGSRDDAYTKMEFIVSLNSLCPSSWEFGSTIHRLHMFSFSMI